MNDPDPDPVVPRLDMAGMRVPRRGNHPRTLVGSVGTLLLLLGGLFAASTSLALLVGVLVALTVGAVTGFLVARRRTGHPLWLCLPRRVVCLRL